MSPARRPTEAELAELMAPVVDRPPPQPEPPAKMKAPVFWPETQQQVAERMKDAIREEGAGDPGPPPQKWKRLKVTDVDGTERVFDLDPYHGGGYMSIERQVARVNEPWIMEPEIARFGLFGVRSLELVDVEPD